MTILREFLKKEQSFIHVSSLRLIIGIFLGLIYSIIFYSFMYLHRELFRIISVTDAYDIWVLTKKEVQFYNLIFAFISVIFGQSMTLSFWFDKPVNVFEKRTFRRFSILNDQRSLNWYFILWFSKSAFIFGILYALMLKGGFYTFSFYPRYNYLFVLIVVVLFLHTWLTLRLTLKWKGLKWVSISFISVTLLAFSLSRINLIDYEKINQKILQKNINYKSKLELPESENYERIEKPSLLEEIYLVRSPGQSESSKPVIITDNEITDLNQLNSRINYWQSKRDYWKNLHTIYYLHIDKSIRMKFVNELKTELTNSGVRNIAYTVIPSHREFDKRFYTRLGLTMRLNNKSLNSNKNTQLNKYTRQIDYVINIKQTKSGFLINDTVFGPGMLKNEIKKFIYQKPNYLIHFHVNDTTSFANYIIVLSSAKQAVIELRNEYSKTQYTKDYADLNEDELIVVTKRFPLFWYESTNENNPK